MVDSLYCTFIVKQVEELNKNASELKECGPLKDRSQSSGEVLCEHKDSGAPHFAHGLCRNCYEDVTPLSFLICPFSSLCFPLCFHACFWLL